MPFATSKNCRRRTTGPLHQSQAMTATTPVLGRYEPVASRCWFHMWDGFYVWFYMVWQCFTMFSSCPLRCSRRQVNAINKAVVATKTAADTIVLSSRCSKLFRKCRSRKDGGLAQDRRFCAWALPLYHSHSTIQTIQIWWRCSGAVAESGLHVALGLEASLTPSYE